MDPNREHQEALAKAGYTGAVGAALFALILSGLGGLLGSVVIAVALNAMQPAISETVSTAAGVLAGAALGAVIAVTKVVRGNREAAEQVEDQEWRRQLLRQHANRGP